MRITLDWLTVKLDEDFTLDDWRVVCELPVVSRETGEQLGIQVPDYYWRFNRYGDGDYISVFGLGTPHLARIAYLYELRVSRVDVAIDFEPKDSEQADLLEKRGILDDYYNSKGITITRGQWDGRASKANGSTTFTYGKRSSDYQARLYSKRINKVDKQFRTRCEYQLRSDYARSFFKALGPNYEDALTLRNETSALLRTIYGVDIFGVGELEDNSLLELPTVEKTHNRELWARTQVLSSFVRHYYETGVNLAQLVVEDFNKLILSNALSGSIDVLTPNEAENQSKTTSPNPTHYTGSKRAEAALKKWFKD